MYITIDRIFIDYDSRNIVLTPSEKPTFSWSIYSDLEGGFQNSYRITVFDRKGLTWDSGEVFNKSPKAVYDGKPLVSGEKYKVTLCVKDSRNCISEEKTAEFCYLAPRKWKAKWITTKEEKDGAKYFFKGFNLKEKPIRATLYVSGLGYQFITVNGEDVEKSYLNPAISAYNERCYYTITDISNVLQVGKNRVCAIVGNGWRNLKRYFSDLPHTENHRPVFMGDTRFIAEIELVYENRIEYVSTDTNWLSGYGAITDNSIFDGEVYDSTKNILGWDTECFSGEGLLDSIVCQSSVGELVPQTLPPVIEQRRITAKNIYKLKEDSYIVDFGENIAGIGCLSLPNGLTAGRKITIEYAEEVFEGDIGKETLRYAKAVDVYIASDNNLKEWIPRTTYHGFRYAKISGLGMRPLEDTLVAIVFCNDIKNKSYFKCGSAVVNQIYENAIRTEMGNLHHLATDCPQRDERLGWMNDATVRFEAMPYAFNTSRMFNKILQDIADEQDKEKGGITCTAPFVWGSRPADPVCSSFLIAGLQCFIHYGDIEPIRKFYEPFKKWNECLSSLTNAEGIVEYSKYGDWAGPADCCVGGFDGQQSALTDPYLMSTGYHYYNYKLLADFAEMLGKTDEKAEFLKKAEKVRSAFLSKWVDVQSGKVDRGSQGAQAFALWLGILPSECELKAAELMYEAVKTAEYRLTTANLTTKYLMEMLAKYGYTDAAWKILTREEYPSWGYMIQHGATTIWERFEQKRGSGMNSHNHPMYGVVYSWLYQYLLGVKPIESGFTNFEISPVFPTGLRYAEGAVDTLLGRIYVCWRKEFNKVYVTVDVPFGATAELILPNGKQTLTSGVHNISFEE